MPDPNRSRRLAQRSRRLARRNSLRCIHCGLPGEEGKTLCREHRLDHREAQLKWRRGAK